ncbi:Nucleoside-diphosphate kinase [Thermobaculum terrenum ATCC BAA-798]|uniref:Nucleoside diphosphate kinase n=1 Tax=Thermobaculum terrenum (strain ATCC BAA-798 / CCMEE 7001 / YNP1) TaxID=525904 RepID=D1CBX4_THET1|nr:nucleoside-diphosphate kinase [Thermobaculum terrenum]ACZ42289.1 Nucleoside-diphosphate kinase [Thermobaculum terrenum ATCC BAA-798]
MERTLVIVKPDAVQRGLIGEVIARIERTGLKLVALKLSKIDRETAHTHYQEHVNKPFFQGLVNFITSGPVVLAVFEGPNAVSIVRKTMGATNPVDSVPGSIRGDLAISLGRNVIHGSDSPESAEREISIFFSPDEILSYERAIDNWILERD